MSVSFMAHIVDACGRDVGPYRGGVTVLVERTVLAATDRWWSDAGRDRALDKARIYDLVADAAGEIEAVWGVLEPESDGSRVFKSRPDDVSLPGLALQVFEIIHGSELVRPADLASFLVVWDVRFFWLRSTTTSMSHGPGYCSSHG